MCKHAQPPKQTPSKCKQNILETKYCQVKSTFHQKKRNYCQKIKKNYVIYIKEWSAFALVKLEEMSGRSRRTLLFLFVYGGWKVFRGLSDA